MEEAKDDTLLERELSRVEVSGQQRKVGTYSDCACREAADETEMTLFQRATEIEGARDEVII